VFFSDDGSTAVEVALKIAFQHFANLGDLRRTRFVALRDGYHGDTVGALSVGDPATFASPFGALTFPVARVGTSSTDELAAVLAERGEEVAAVVVEPMVQAAGGMRLHRPEFLRGVADLCRRHGALWIADEVMTGFGRTGRTFAVEHAGVTPDVLCLAKGLTGGALPLAATLVSARVEAPFRDADPRKAFLHGHSYTANPIACAAARANLDVFANEPVAERIAAIEARYAARLPALRGRARVADVRWLGTLGVVELAASGEAGWFADLGPRLRREFVRRGVLLRPLGPVVYVLPPYATTPAEIDGVIDAIEEVVASLP
jgi:adenosylmethionine-8-amino-7-oxononanoate aminotransferase